MEEQYIIVRENGMWLLEMHFVGAFRDLRWAKKGKPQYGIRFNKEEALETIRFITNVIDWELGEQLTIVKLES